LIARYRSGANIENPPSSSLLAEEKRLRSGFPTLAARLFESCSPSDFLALAAR
jgi:hypothetical protein